MAVCCWDGLHDAHCHWRESAHLHASLEASQELTRYEVLLFSVTSVFPWPCWKMHALQPSPLHALVDGAVPLHSNDGHFRHRPQQRQVRLSALVRLSRVRIFDRDPACRQALVYAVPRRSCQRCRSFGVCASLVIAHTRCHLRVCFCRSSRTRPEASCPESPRQAA